MQKAFANPQSIIDDREIKDTKTIDNRVTGIHIKLVEQLRDETYEIGYTYKIVGKFSEDEIYKVSDYCVRKARNPGHAFVAIFEKKLRQAL